MAWRISNYNPQDLLDAGYKIINTSWQPLYVVNNRKWHPYEIFEWNKHQWKGSADPVDAKGVVVDENPNLLGGQMCAWEQGQYKELHSLRKRLAAMSARLWNKNDSILDDFEIRLKHTDNALENYLFPFNLKAEGLTFPAWEDANFYENFYFQDSIRLVVYPQPAGLSLHYTTNGELPTVNDPVFDKPLYLLESSKFHIQAFDNLGNPKGHPRMHRFFFHPIKAAEDGCIKPYLPNSWEKHKFLAFAQVKLEHKREGNIKYTLDGSKPTLEDSLYAKPLRIFETANLRAQLFDGNGDATGAEFSQEYVKLKRELSLTTAKPVRSNNIPDEPGLTQQVNDGQIARWDHWGAHATGDNWVIIDLEKPETLARFKLYTFWDGYRYYTYTIETSLDEQNWTQVVDASINTQVSKPDGQEHKIEPIEARYIKLNVISNSANPGLHVVELNAWGY